MCDYCVEEQEIMKQLDWFTSEMKKLEVGDVMVFSMKDEIHGLRESLMKLARAGDAAWDRGEACDMWDPTPF